MQQSKSIRKIIAIWSIVASLIVFFGNLGSNQVNAASYDSNAAYSYAEKYAYKVCSDGYFYEKTWPPSYLGAGVPVPSGGYDCAHFVSCCIGSEPNEQGGGLDVSSRTGVEYGEPGAKRLGDWLLDNDIGIEASSIDEIEQGDVINYDWDGDRHWDHAAIYLGNYKIAAHSNSHWNAFWNLGGAHNYRFIHITTADQNPPTVDAFDVAPEEVTLSNSFTISYTVSDDIGLERVELWRAIDDNGDGNPDWPEGQDDYIDIKHLSGKKSHSDYFTDTPSSTGTYWYGIHVVDTDGQLSYEPDPPGPIKVIVGLPDLIVPSCSVTSSVPYYPNSSLRLSCIIKNQGEGSAGSSKVKYYLSTSSNGTDSYLGSDNVSSLSSGGTSSENGNVTIPSNITTNRNYYVVFYADGDRQIAESNENNNKNNAGTIYVQSPPQHNPTITITTPSSDPYNTVSTPITISGTCSDEDGDLSSVKIENSANGHQETKSISGSSSNFSFSVPLKDGSNRITVTAYDSGNRTGTDTVTVNKVESDTTPPTILSKVPPPNETNVLVTTNIQVIFSEPMNRSATESAFSITPSVPGHCDWQDNTLIFIPGEDLAFRQTYTIIITSDAYDLAGNPLAYTEWSFTTVDDSCFFADLDCDGDVDIVDVRLIAYHWNTKAGDALYDAKYDFNNDNRIDIIDVRKVAQYWGQKLPCAPVAKNIAPSNFNSKTIHISLQASQSKINVGEKFEVKLLTDEPYQFQAVEFHLEYDKDKLKAYNVLLGDNFTNSSNPTITLGPKIEEKKGRIVAGVVLLGDENASTSCNSLATMEFVAQKEGIAQFVLKELKLIDSENHLLLQVKTHNLIQIHILPRAPIHSALLQNFPNPFNPETWIPFQLAKFSKVQIRIYSISGQLIRTLHLGYKDAGYYQDKASAAYWDGKNESGEYVTSGAYFYTLQAGDFIATRKMVIMR